MSDFPDGPPVDTEDDDQIPPAWMLEPDAWGDVQIEQSVWLEGEDLQGDDADLSQLPGNESRAPNFLQDSIEVLDIFYPDKLEPFAKAKAQRDALRKAAGTK